MLQPFSSSPSPNVRWLLSAISLLFLCNLLLGPSLAQLLFQLDGPQPCPDNPIRLPALRTVQYIYSPYDEQRNYPADTDCQFLIEASDPQHRIHLSVMDSELEEPLFTECNDFVSVREGNETSPKEVARWCGQDFPASISSASDSLLVHFHSDSVVQKRGFNISFVQFELPGCPPDWKSDTASPFCYKLFVLPHILTWFEAQKECNFERANLATFRDEADYAFVFAQHSDIHSFPWIGYTDAYAEGVFEAVDRNVPLWPENFPLKQENEMRDCVYLDWNKKDRIHYEIDDCRNRKPFLCKKRKDGTEVPVLLPAGLIRRGFHDSSLDYSLLVGVIVLLLLVLVVACLLYNKFRERSNNNRVVNVDLNQRLVQQQQGGAAADSRSTLQIGTGKSVSDQKAAAAAALAKEKERREKKYEQKSGKNMAAGPSRRSPPKPLESQESTTSFPLHTFQSVFAKQTQMEMETRQMAQQTGRAAQSPAHSPRISLSPNQPDLDESQRQGRRDQQEVEEEEEDRHNMGYEPDSEEESERRREREEGEEEQQIRERDEAERNWREEDKEEGEGEQKRQQQRAEQQLQQEEEAVNKGEGETSANVAASAATGIIGSLGPRTTTTEHPVRPPIELLMDSEKKSRKERRAAEDEQQQPPVAPPLREGTLFSTGQQTADSGQSRMRHRRKSFERPPPVGPLDSVSAISLDEFWQQQQQQQPQLQQQQPQQPLPPPQQK